jgi:hypothetical protein
MYVDADAVIRKTPSFIDTVDTDISIHRTAKGELLSGTIILNRTDATIKLLDTWIEEQKKTPLIWDQKVLDRCLNLAPVTNTPLPVEYIKIFDAFKGTDPVVEHFQASRRFKDKLFNNGFIPVEEFPGCKIRYLKDSSFTILHHDAKAEAFFDNKYCRVKNELRWYPIKADRDFLTKNKNLYKGQTCFIIGKGPSLDELTEADFYNTGPVIGLNEAFNKLQTFNLQNPVYGTQLDAWMKDACYPKKGTLFTSPRAQIFYPDCSNAICVPPSTVGQRPTPGSFAYAIAIARIWGCYPLILYCFDAAMDKNCGYAKCVGYEPTNMGNPERFLGHRDAILKHATGIPLEFRWPIQGSNFPKSRRYTSAVQRQSCSAS